MSEGLQIQRYAPGDPMMPFDTGPYCLFSDAEKIVDQLVEAVKLLGQTGLGHDIRIATVDAALKAVGEKT